jgi:hypothetical protein
MHSTTIFKKLQITKLTMKINTLFQGYQVTIYDLGGSKSFRGIWDKYYHEVKRIFVIINKKKKKNISHHVR